MTADGKEDPEGDQYGKVHTDGVLDRSDRGGGCDSRAAEDTAIWRREVRAVDNDLDSTVFRLQLNFYKYIFLLYIVQVYVFD